MDPLIIMMLFGAFLFLGFLASYTFTRTKIPDSLFLILLGLLMSQVVDTSRFLSIAGLAASVALAVILFDAGLNTDMRSMMAGLVSSLYLGIIGFILSSAVLTAIFHYSMHYPLIYALLYGFSLGGGSAAIVIPMAESLKLDTEKTTLLGLESTTTNILEVVFGLSIAQLILKSSIDPRLALSTIFSSFSIGIVLGTVTGFVWIKILKQLRGKPYSYMLTLALLFILYGFTETVGGSGALAALTFGFLLGNSKEITKLMHLPRVSTGRFAQFHDEIAFLIRTYFFLFLGTVLRIPSRPETWAIALLATVGLLVARAIAITILRMDAKLIAFLPRGLNEAVLGVMYTTMGIEHSSEMLLLISLIIIFSNLISAPLLHFLFRKEKELKGENQKNSA